MSAAPPPPPKSALVAATAPGKSVAAAAAAAATKSGKPTLWSRVKGAGSSAASSAASRYTTVATAVKTATASVPQTPEEFKAYANSVPVSIILGVLTIIYLIVTLTFSFDFETKDNIARKTAAAIKPWMSYGTDEPKRNSLSETITKSGIPQSQLCLTNFMIRTANVAGILTSDKRTVVSLDAIRYALLGGARAFVFDLWPDTEPGNYQRGPVLKTMESTSMWLRTSYNSVPFVSALSHLVYLAFNGGYKSVTDDPIIIYLRFRTAREGKTPRTDTMEMTAKTLQSVIQPYRLDAAFNRCRGQAELPILSITTFKKKVIVVSNVNGAGTTLADYINISNLEGIPVEQKKDYSKSITPANANEGTDMKDRAINTIKTNLTFTAPYGEDPEAYTNGWNILDAMKLGVHCTGMYMDPKKMPPAIANLFSVDSFVLKPAELRYTPTTLPSPQTTPNLGFGRGANAGGITSTQPFQAPGT